jgi:hypothetical protein
MTVAARFGAAALLCLASPPIAAQTIGPASGPAVYDCAANAHCTISCTVDGEKTFQTGSPKTVTVKPLAPNNYLVELVEQGGHTLSYYLAGTKVICSLEGLTKAGQAP